MRENGKCNPSQWDDFDERSCELGLLAVACYSFSLGIPALRKNVCSVSLHQIMKPLVKLCFFIKNKRKPSSDLHLLVSYVLYKFLVYSLDGKTHINTNQLEHNQLFAWSEGCSGKNRWLVIEMTNRLTHLFVIPKTSLMLIQVKHLRGPPEPNSLTLYSTSYQVVRA